MLYNPMSRKIVVPTRRLNEILIDTEITPELFPKLFHLRVQCDALIVISFV